MLKDLNLLSHFVLFSLHLFYVCVWAGAFRVGQSRSGEPGTVETLLPPPKSERGLELLPLPPVRATGSTRSEGAGKDGRGLGSLREASYCSHADARQSHREYGERGRDTGKGAPALRGVGLGAHC